MELLRNSHFIIKLSCSLSGLVYYKVVLQFSGSSGSLILLFPKILIIWLSNLSNLRVPDEGYSRNAPCALTLISTFLFLILEKKTVYQCCLLNPLILLLLNVEN
jgi:hypothetical protein